MHRHANGGGHVPNVMVIPAVAPAAAQVMPCMLCGCDFPTPPLPLARSVTACFPLPLQPCAAVGL